MCNCIGLFYWADTKPGRIKFLPWGCNFTVIIQWQRTWQPNFEVIKLGRSQPRQSGNALTAVQVQIGSRGSGRWKLLSYPVCRRTQHWPGWAPQPLPRTYPWEQERCSCSTLPAQGMGLHLTSHRNPPSLSSPEQQGQNFVTTQKVRRSFIFPARH